MQSLDSTTFNTSRSTWQGDGCQGLPGSIRTRPRTKRSKACGMLSPKGIRFTNKSFCGWSGGMLWRASSASQDDSYHDLSWWLPVEYLNASKDFCVFFFWADVLKNDICMYLEVFLYQSYLSLVSKTIAGPCWHKHKGYCNPVGNPASPGARIPRRGVILLWSNSIRVTPTDPEENCKNSLIPKMIPKWPRMDPKLPQYNVQRVPKEREKRALGHPRVAKRSPARVRPS